MINSVVFTCVITVIGLSMISRNNLKLQSRLDLLCTQCLFTGIKGRTVHQLVISTVTYKNVVVEISIHRFAI